MPLTWNLSWHVVSYRREALALQEKCAQECTAPYRCVINTSLQMYTNKNNTSVLLIDRFCCLLLIPRWHWMILLTLICRAPELFEVPSNCEIDERSDMWSLGCTLYAMAYGELIFQMENYSWKGLSTDSRFTWNDQLPIITTGQCAFEAELSQSW